jgi:thiamine biosynthesis lipoprotein
MKRLSIFGGLVAAALIFACSDNAELKPSVRYLQAFDREFQIQVYDTSKSSNEINRAMFAVERELYRLEGIYGEADTSIISQLNRNSWKAPLSADVRDFFIRSQAYFLESDGLVDITLRPLYDLYDFDGRQYVPSAEELRSALDQSGAELLQINDNRLRLNGRRLDLRPLLRGHILRMLGDKLKQLAINDFLLTTAGAIEFDWQHPQSPAKIYIRHPRHEGKYFGMLEVATSSGVATEADFQKYFMHNGRRYHTALSPQSGLPADNMIAITVLSNNAEVADFYCSYLFQMELQAAREIVLMDPTLEALIIFSGEDGMRHWLSPGLRDKFELYEEDA